ncbi:MAG: hypothetical protein U7127_00825 [Phormidium sp.]
MQYPLNNISQPVVGSEAKKIVDAIKSGSYVANEPAIATAKRIADRRKQQKKPETLKGSKVRYSRFLHIFRPQ